MRSQFNRRWAIYENGIVTDTRESDHALTECPFKLEDGQRAVDVTKIPCEIGYHVDHKGQVAAIPGRVVPLLKGEPAYHDRSNPPALATAAQNQHLYTGEPHAGETFPTLGSDD